MKLIISWMAVSLALFMLSACASFSIPKDYVPDEKVVYLTQNPRFVPIAYKASSADPYEFAALPATINPMQPSFVKTAQWDTLLVPDFQADSLLYREAEAHFSYILKLPLIRELREKLDSADIQVTPALSPKMGEKIKEYSNGGVYVYPDSPGAEITVLTNGYYEIVFADKGYFRYQIDGSYERADPNRQLIFAYYPKQSQIVSTISGTTYRLDPAFRELSEPRGKLSYTPKPEAQYQFTPSESGGSMYTFFVDENRKTVSVLLQLKNGLRFDFFPDEEAGQKRGVLITKGNEALFIDQSFRKFHERFNPSTRMAKGLLSLYLPEGIRLANMAGTEPAFSIVKPAWPELYKTKALGPFDILYTAQDESLVRSIKADRLAALESKARSLTGLGALGRRTVLLPPDLESYKRLHANRPGDVMNWFPSGFATKDIIIMWPASVPRYQGSEAISYFLETEFYEILSHEYVHVLVGQNIGIGSPSPIWLNEGLAVWVESHFSAEVKHYWDTTFTVSQGLNRLLDWDTVSTTSTGELPVAKARVHYAQSYALVAALQKNFGAAKVAAYIKSFRVAPEEASKVDLKSSYTANFKKVFGIDFDMALKFLEPAPAK